MFNVTKPELIWIEGRCYRAINALPQTSSFQEHDLYENDLNYDMQDQMNDDDDDDDNIDVQKIDETRFVASQHVSKQYIGVIIGKKGATKVRVERDTKTDIKIPKPGQTGDIMIYGEQPMNVKSAWRQINTIVISSRLKQTATHFISIPMTCPEIKNNFEKFKVCVLRDCAAPGLEESLFMKPEALHLTIGVMCLMDNEERLQVSKLLNDAKKKVLMPILQKKLPVNIRLKGLSYMNDDPKRIDVLYGRVQEEDSSGVVQIVADALVEYFYKAGFMPKEFDREHVKLHVTLMNSKLKAKSATNSKGSSNFRQTREKFDGSAILDKFADYDFGSMQLTEIHLSQRHAYGPDGYYQATSVVSCNE